MTLREACEQIVGIDTDPLGCAFVIAGLLRTAVQGEPSTFEGECASIVKAQEVMGISATSPADIRRWLDDLGRLADLDMSNEFWLNMVTADMEDEE